VTGLSLSLHTITDAASLARHENHDSAWDTQQDIGGNVNEQNQECPVGVSGCLHAVASMHGTSKARVLSQHITSFWRCGAGAVSTATFISPARNSRLRIGYRNCRSYPSDLSSLWLFNHASLRIRSAFFIREPSWSFAEHEDASSPSFATYCLSIWEILLLSDELLMK